LRLRCH